MKRKQRVSTKTACINQAALGVHLVGRWRLGTFGLRKSGVREGARAGTLGAFYVVFAVVCVENDERRKVYMQLC